MKIKKQTKVISKGPICLQQQLPASTAAKRTKASPSKSHSDQSPRTQATAAAKRAKPKKRTCHRNQFGPLDTSPQAGDPLKLKSEKTSKAAPDSTIGPTAPKMSANQAGNAYYKNRFCGLPIGVRALPTFAAMCDRTMDTDNRAGIFKQIENQQRQWDQGY
jgi:hypothetical protein